MGDRRGRRRRHKRHKDETNLRWAGKESFLTPTTKWRGLPPGSFVFDDFAWTLTPEAWKKVEPVMKRLGRAFAIWGITHG